MHLRAMRHSTVQVVRHPGNWPAIVMGLAGSALLPAVLRDPSTASPAFTGPFTLPGEPGLPTAREQDNGKPSS